MSDLISKLNVLVRASLNSVTSGASDNVSETRRISPERLGKDIDKEIAALHKHIDDALAAEDKMQAQLNDAYAQMDAFDKRADAALLAGDDDNARSLVQQLQRQRRHTSVLEDALEDHRRATSELIERVNMMESMVSDARRTEAESAAVPPLADTSNASAADAPGEVLSSLLRDARQRIDQTLNAAPPNVAPSNVVNAAPASPTNTVPPDTTPSRSVPITIHRDPPPDKAAQDTAAPDKAVPDSAAPRASTPSVSVPINKPKPSPDPAVDDDLARRRSRLSKPDGT